MIDNQSITAVIFAYNEEKYISSMIESILKQTIKIDSIIIVDDFSTDNTKKIIHLYKEKHGQIEYYLSDKKGKINAYQTGLKYVKTDLFFICAGDDVLMENFARSLYEYIQEHQVLYSYANYVMVDEDLNPIKQDGKKKFYKCDELIEKNYVSGYLFGYSSIISQITPLPKELQFEDWYTSIKLSYTYGNAYIYTEALFYYRRHEKASTANFNTKEKYFFYLDRDIKLFEVVIQENFIADKDLKMKIQSRLLYLQTLRNYNLFKGIKNSLKKHLSLKERIKLLSFPLYFNFKYH